MKIHWIAFENFRSFKEKAELANIKPVSIFVGPNNAGKSNVIEMLSFIRGMAMGSWSRRYDDLVYDKNNKNIHVEIELELTEDERRKIFSFMPNLNLLAAQVNFSTDGIFKYIKYSAQIGRQRCVAEDLYITDQNKAYVHIIHHQWTQGNSIMESTIANFNGLGTSPTLNQISGLQPAVKNQAGTDAFGFLTPMVNPNEPVYQITSMLVPFLQNIRIFGPYRKANVRVGGSEQNRMDETGSNVVGVMTTIIGADTDEFSRIMGIYKEIVGGIKTVNVPLVGNEHTLRVREDGLNSQIDFANMSVGLHQALILVFAIEKAGENETICIEEPEIHLHASAQKRLFRYIRQQCRKNQFFITTHSSIFTSIDDDVGTYLVTKPKANSQIVLIDKEKDLRFIKQQLGIRNSDVFGSDYVIFVEGDSEEYAFPIVAGALGYDDVGTDMGKKIRLINLDGNGIIPKLWQFLNYLKTSDTEVFVIADGDKKVHSALDGFVQEDLLQKDHTKVWEKEFEDEFESKRIMDAMKKLSNKNHFAFDMELAHLDAEKSSGKKVADILQKYLYEKTQPDLNKPELAQQLAYDIVEEIKTVSSRTETQFELEVKRIMDIIHSKDKNI